MIVGESNFKFYKRKNFKKNENNYFIKIQKIKETKLNFTKERKEWKFVFYKILQKRHLQKEYIKIKETKKNTIYLHIILSKRETVVF